MALPLLITRLRCLRCRQGGSVVFYYDKEYGRFFTEAPCSCIWQQPNSLAGYLPQPPGGEGPWSPFVFWGGRPGYAVGPEGAVPLVTGWKFAAPYDEAQYHILGESEGVYIALRLTESEWLWWEHPTHLACGEELGDATLTFGWLRDRLFVGTRSDRYGPVVFRPLKPVND